MLNAVSMTDICATKSVIGSTDSRHNCTQSEINQPSACGTQAHTDSVIATAACVSLDQSTASESRDVISLSSSGLINSTSAISTGASSVPRAPNGAGNKSFSLGCESVIAPPGCTSHSSMQSQSEPL